MNLGIYSNNTSEVKDSSITINKPMLILGEEDKPYERYGASPSLEYKSEVQACGDNVNIAKINENYWKLTANNTIKNKARNDNVELAKMSVKAGQVINVYLKLLSKPIASTTIVATLNTTINPNNFGNINNFELSLWIW